jgi:hypothetical protein
MIWIVNQVMLPTDKSLTFAGWYISVKGKVVYTNWYMVIDLWATRCMVYKKQELLTIGEDMDSPAGILVRSVLLIY